MKKMIERGTEGAFLGGVLGGALGTILSGTALLIPGVNLIAGPLFVASAITTVSGTAAGTLIGGTAGAVSGAVEDIQDNKED